MTKVFLKFILSISILLVSGYSQTHAQSSLNNCVKFQLKKPKSLDVSDYGYDKHDYSNTIKITASVPGLSNSTIEALIEEVEEKEEENNLSFINAYQSNKDFLNVYHYSWALSCSLQNLKYKFLIAKIPSALETLGRYRVFEVFRI